jgi:DNA polymerase III epsilon subunit-like protein
VISKDTGQIYGVCAKRAGCGEAEMLQNHRRLAKAIFNSLDTETTGQFPTTRRLVKVGVVRFRLDGQELATFHTLIDPEMPFPKDVQQMHGITDTMVRGKPTIEQVLPQFIEFLGTS